MSYELQAAEEAKNVETEAIEKSIVLGAFI